MSERVTLTVAEYEALKAGKPAAPTVVVDAEEYAALVAYKAQGTKQDGDYTRVVGRMRELEMLLRREMQDHVAELAEAHKRIKQLGG
jgi:hypothetical protein